MRVVWGAVDDVERDREVTRQLADLVEESGTPVVRAWTPPRQVAFGRRDAVADGYDRAREAAVERNFEPVERGVGGHAVAYTGETVAFVYAVPDGDGRSGIQTRYQGALNLLQRAFLELDVTLWRGEPDDAFCPGTHSLQHDGKVVGVAQRVRRESALVGGYVVVSEADAADVAAVLEPVYDALDVPFDPASVGSVEGAGGPDDPDRVVETLETAFVGDGTAESLAVSDLLAEGSQ